MRMELSKLSQIETERESQRQEWNKRQLASAKMKVASLIRARQERVSSEESLLRRKALFTKMMSQAEDERGRFN